MNRRSCIHNWGDIGAILACGSIVCNRSRRVGSRRNGTAWLQCRTEDRFNCFACSISTYYFFFPSDTFWFTFLLHSSFRGKFLKLCYRWVRDESASGSRVLSMTSTGAWHLSKKSCSVEEIIPCCGCFGFWFFFFFIHLKHLLILKVASHILSFSGQLLR